MSQSKDTLPKLSIVIACYNDKFVSKAIKSAYDLVYPNKEIIVVDDGSNEETESIIDSVREYLDILITQKNQGQSVARNNGIKRASGEYILNLDSDDFFEPSFAGKAVHEFRSDKTVKIVTCQARRFDKKGSIDIFTPRGGEIGSFLFQNSALGSSMFRRKDWEIIGGYEEDLSILGFEDWEFYIQILKKGGKAHVIPEPLFHYQVREGSTTSRIKHSKQDKFKHIILKHQDLYKDNFEALVEDLSERVNKVERQKVKLLNGIDHRAGRVLWKPFRVLKSIFNSSN